MNNADGTTLQKTSEALSTINESSTENFKKTKMSGASDATSGSQTTTATTTWTDYQRFIAVSRYARWRDEDNRRETWEESVSRYCDYLYQNVYDGFDYDEIYSAILNLEVMPSMRALMTAGPALERCNVAAYNCSYLPVDSPRAFDETMYILMCGTGVGFSVEKKYVEQLPIVNEHFEQSDTVINVGDSKSGWARAFRELVSLLYAGQVPTWDTSRVRPAGARLKTFGGRASGPGPLESLFDFTVRLFSGAKGRRLTPLECHDLMCKIGEVVVVGGVRRSAMISLGDLEDDGHRNAKVGSWWEINQQRALSNNSAVYEERPSVARFISEWLSLYNSKSGERGLFNRRASKHQALRSGRRDGEFDFGTNPCSEIILRPYQFCNLTEVVVRESDTYETLARKVKIATILGTLQSTLTDFKYLRKIWKHNTEEERLLGVSLTGIFDNKCLWHNKGWLEGLKNVAIETNKNLAASLGIPQSTAITCVKPSGTVSQLVDSASGIHPRWSNFYVRTVRGDRKDPLTQFLIDQGVPNEPDITQPDSTVVFSFPQAAPVGGQVREGLGACAHLDIWKTVQEAWCEHKPSITINVKEDEWLEVGAWVYKNFDILSGVSFLPYSEHTYKQAPYQEISREQYDELLSKMPNAIDWDRLSDYEREDETIGSQTYACSADSCEIVDFNIMAGLIAKLIPFKSQLIIAGLGILVIIFSSSISYYIGNSNGKTSARVECAQQTVRVEQKTVDHIVTETKERVIRDVKREQQLQRDLEQARKSVTSLQSQLASAPRPTWDSRLSVGDVSLLNAAVSGGPGGSTNTPSVPASAFQTPSDVDSHDVTEWGINVVGQYNELAKLHDETVDWMMDELVNR